MDNGMEGPTHALRHRRPGLLGLHKPGEPHSPLALTIRPTSHTSAYGRTKPFMGCGCCSYPAGNG